MPFEKVEYSFPDAKEETYEVEVGDSSALTVDTSGKTPLGQDAEIEVEIVDDTPKEDRDRKVSDPPEEVTEEELGDYSDKVRNRIKHFSKGYHDERRAKE